MQSPSQNPYQLAGESLDSLLQCESLDGAGDIPFPELPKELLEVTDDSSFQPSLNQLPPDAFQRAALNPSQQLLNEIAQLHLEQKRLLEQMEHAQRAAFLAPTPENLATLDNEQKMLKVKMDSELRALQQLKAQVTLEAADLHRLLYLEQEVSIQLKQLELFYHELQQIGQGAVRCIAALVIVNQPFAQVVGKGRVFREDQLVVKLLTGATSQFSAFSPVQAIVVFEAAAKAGVRLVEQDVQPMDPHTRLVRFPLRFVNGSRRTCINFRFSLQVAMPLPTGQVVPHTVESNLSNPFVITTHDSQWEQAEGCLLKKEAFNGQVEVGWIQLANTLQRRFLVATRQDLMRPSRPLSPFDLHYLSVKFFGARPVVDQRQFDAFWAWFGKLLYGFWSREDVEAQIRGQEIGTFLIRFAERHAGHFGIAYVSSDGSIKHYLVTEADTTGAKKTLPDFLHTCPQFAHILQLTADANGNPAFNKCAKASVLDQLCARRPDAPKPSPGYQPLQ